MPAPAVLRLVCAVVACAAVCTPAAGCGDIRRTSEPVPTVSRPLSSAEAAPEPGLRCFDRAATKVVLTAADGVKLAAARLGSGPRGLVLVDGESGDMCRWAGFAQQWVAAGFQVLAFDLRCARYSDCGRRADHAGDVLAAGAALRARGAATVQVVGASLAGTAALVAAARPAARVDAVVALSAHSPGSRVAAPGPHADTLNAAVSQLRAPLLLVHTRDDRLAMPVADAAALVAAAPATEKQLVVRPGTSHGCGLLYTGADIRGLVDDFLRRHG